MFNINMISIVCWVLSSQEEKCSNTYVPTEMLLLQPWPSQYDHFLIHLRTTLTYCRWAWKQSPEGLTCTLCISKIALIVFIVPYKSVSLQLGDFFQRFIRLWCHHNQWIYNYYFKSRSFKHQKPVTVLHYVADIGRA